MVRRIIDLPSPFMAGTASMNHELVPGGESSRRIDVVLPDGFEVACVPMKVRRGFAGWTGAVAILP